MTTVREALERTPELGGTLSFCELNFPSGQVAWVRPAGTTVALAKMEMYLWTSRLFHEHVPGTCFWRCRRIVWKKTKYSFCTATCGESRGGGIILGAQRDEIVGHWRWTVVQWKLPVSNCFSNEQIFNEHLPKSVGWMWWWTAGMIEKMSEIQYHYALIVLVFLLFTGPLGYSWRDSEA